ncbi:MAG: lycopene cyclase family protein, partial [Bacteroidota bacterium]
MATKTTFDLIIAGAGASGLSLVRNILASEKLNDLSILLLDLSLTPTNDKTWCFWDDSNLTENHLIHRSWKTLEVRAYGDLYTEDLQAYRYHCLRSVDYTAAILEMAEKSSRVTLLEASIKDFTHYKGSATVHTDKGDFTAPWIFQSALKPPGFENLWVDVSLKQHFLGAELKADKPVFDTKTVVLMDFDTSQKHGVTFFYILPYSETEALVEYTFFTEQLLSHDEYMKGIGSYMLSRYGLSSGQYSVTRTETGSIPMEDRRYPAWYNPRVMNIGTTGGLTKPSTGYTFTRIQQHSKAIT